MNLGIKTAFLALVVVGCSSPSEGDGVGTGASTSGGASAGGGGGSGGSSSASGGSTSTGGVGATAGSGGGSTGGSAGAGGTTVGSGGSGGSGEVSTGGGDSGLDYNPCPEEAPCNIMALGDSITAGAGSADIGGWREPFFHLALTHEASIDLVGSVEYGPETVDGVAFPDNCECHGGFTIDDGGGRWGISGLTPISITTWKPHIIPLMIGTNDVDIELDLDNAPTRLGNLLDSVAETDPNVLLVVSTIIPTTDDAENVRVQAYNAAIPDLVQSRADAGQRIIMVDMYAAFTENPNYKTEYMYDKLHPKEAGYAKMAEVWYDAIGGLFH